MIELRPSEILITIQSQNPVEDLFSIQQSLMTVLQTIDPTQLTNPDAPLFFYVELLKSVLPNDHQQRKLLVG
jgi:hypothetical protein